MAMSMCQPKYQNIEAMSQTIKSHYYLVKLTQLLISVSIFSFIFSPSSLFVFLHYFKFYFSTFPFQLFTHNIDKNSMFLLCNGLLVFVGITKSFSGSSSDDDDNKTSNLEEEEEELSSHVLDVEVLNKPMLEIREESKMETSSELDEQNIVAAEQELLDIKTCFEEEVQENNEKVIFIDDVKEVDEETSQQDLKEETELFDVDDEEQDKGSEENDYFRVEENMELEEEEEEEEESCISTEELNKKFEDFIRKMKEDLRIEARRQLVVMV